MPLTCSTLHEVTGPKCRTRPSDGEICEQTNVALGGSRAGSRGFTHHVCLVDYSDVRLESAHEEVREAGKLGQGRVYLVQVGLEYRRVRAVDRGAQVHRQLEISEAAPEAAGYPQRQRTVTLDLSRRRGVFFLVFDINRFDSCFSKAEAGFIERSIERRKCLGIFLIFLAWSIKNFIAQKINQLCCTTCFNGFLTSTIFKS